MSTNNKIIHINTHSALVNNQSQVFDAMQSIACESKMSSDYKYNQELQKSYMKLLSEKK